MSPRLGADQSPELKTPPRVRRDVLNALRLLCHQSVTSVKVFVNRIKDVRRGLDYLLTRNDIDPHRIALFGPSAGARIGLILAAVENRYAAVVLQGAGVVPDDRMVLPEANPINFAPHIGARNLMMHGRYDEDTPFKTRAEPLFKLLREPKRLMMFEGSHVPPTELFVTNINAFLDEALGPVRRE